MGTTCSVMAIIPKAHSRIVLFLFLVGKFA